MTTVKDARKEKGWSQATLAYKAGVSSMTIVRIERGHAVIKSVRDAVCTALGTEDVNIVVKNRVKSAQKSS